MEKVTNSSALRSNLSLVLDEVQFNQDSYVIERKGRPAAVIVPLTVYENWKQSRERFFETVRRIQEANKNADPDEVLQDVLEAQQAVRAKMPQEQ
jgi:prevent-host-death family protein